MTAIVKHLRNHKPPQQKKQPVIISEHQKKIGNVFYHYFSRGLLFYFLVFFGPKSHGVDLQAGCF